MVSRQSHLVLSSTWANGNISHHFSSLPSLCLPLLVVLCSCFHASRCPSMLWGAIPPLQRQHEAQAPYFAGLVGGQWGLGVVLAPLCGGGGGWRTPAPGNGSDTPAAGDVPLFSPRSIPSRQERRGCACSRLPVPWCSWPIQRSTGLRQSENPKCREAPSSGLSVWRCGPRSMRGQSQSRCDSSPRRLSHWIRLHCDQKPAAPNCRARLS